MRVVTPPVIGQFKPYEYSAWSNACALHPYFSGPPYWITWDCLHVGVKQFQYVEFYKKSKVGFVVTNFLSHVLFIVIDCL